MRHTLRHLDIKSVPLGFPEEQKIITNLDPFEKILGRPISSDEMEQLDRMAHQIAIEEDRYVLQFLEKLADKKLRKTNYRAWKAKHGK